MNHDIDASVLEEIRDLDEETYVEVIRTYLDELPENLQTIQAAVEARDATSLIRAAHRLKGASSTMGLTAMASLCKTLEEQGRKGNAEAGMPVLPQLQDAAGSCQEYLQSLL